MPIVFREGSTPMPANDLFCYEGRRLPALFIIGAQKCATTSLARMLFAENGFSRGVPFEDNRFSDTKEHHFFDVEARWSKGLEYYAQSFPSCDKAAYTLDGTPDYLHSRGAAARLSQLYGPERLARTTVVVSLCEPVQRAQSTLYHMRLFVGKGLDQSQLIGPTLAHIQKDPHISFRDLVRRDADVARQAREQPGTPHDDFNGVLFSWGRYGWMLDEWVSAIGELHVIPLPLYSHHELATRLELTCIVRRRSQGLSINGSMPSAAPWPPTRFFSQPDAVGALGSSCDSRKVVEPPPGPRIGSFAHPPLAEDIDPDDAMMLEQSFEASNERVYQLLRDDPRVRVLPSGLSESEYAGFLTLGSRCPACLRLPLPPVMSMPPAALPPAPMPLQAARAEYNSLSVGADAQYNAHGSAGPLSLLVAALVFLVLRRRKRADRAGESVAGGREGERPEAGAAVLV